MILHTQNTTFDIYISKFDIFISKITSATANNIQLFDFFQENKHWKCFCSLKLNLGLQFRGGKNESCLCNTWTHLQTCFNFLPNLVPYHNSQHFWMFDRFLEFFKEMKLIQKYMNGFPPECDFLVILVCGSKMSLFCVFEECYNWLF